MSIHGFMTHATTIIAYTYEADYHCVACARKRFAIKRTGTVNVDCNDIPIEQQDCEGNTIGVIFATDPDETIHCGDCHGLIYDFD